MAQRMVLGQHPRTQPSKAKYVNNYYGTGPAPNIFNKQPGDFYVC